MNVICIKSKIVVNESGDATITLPKLWVEFNRISDNKTIYFIICNNKVQVQLIEPINTEIFDDLTQDLIEKIEIKEGTQQPNYGYSREYF